MQFTGPAYPTATDTVADGGWFTPHAIGVTDTLPKGTTIAEAFDKALGWNVATGKAMDATTGLIVPNLKLVRRTDNDEVLGWGKDGFTPIQNSECQEILEGGLADIPHSVAAALSLRGGRRTAVVIALDDVGRINVDGDTIDPFLVLSNSFDGSSALRLLSLGWRPGCTNMLSLFWSRSGARKAMVSVRHTRNAEAAYDSVRAAVRRFAIVRDEFQAEVERLIRTELTRAQEQAGIDAIAPIPTGEDVSKARRTRAERRREAIIDLYRHDPRVGFTGTAWGLLQAVSTFEQNDSGFRSTPGGPRNRGERKVERALDGGRVERRAHELIDRVLATV